MFRLPLALLLAASCSRSDGPMTDPEPAAPQWVVASDTVQHGPFTNRLASATSPYLLQHAHNPVDWYPWGDEAFAEATRRDVPVFLSIGYAACHWCHVMEEESFEDPVLAAYLNANFVPIKVDREERPDVDAVYMDAVVALSGRGGWPASIWLTPEREPFLAGTYYPPQSSRGRPGFRDVLEQITTLWQTRRQDVNDDATALVQALERAATVTQGDVPESVAPATMTALMSQWDSTNHGWGRKKFPMTPRLEAMLAYGLVASEPAVHDAVRQTLWAMDRGGLHDQIGGGFHRYTVEEAWQIPHFEKMLYDNGQLLSVYAAASAVFDEPRFAEVARDTAEWMLTALRDPDSGAFYSSLDADTDGQEGTTYVWTPAQLQEVLDDDASAVASAYAVTAQGNFEGATVLTRPTAEPPAQELRQRLLSARQLRAQPRTDTKRVVSYNALAIQGLARAGRLLGEPRYIVAAEQAATAVLAARHADGSMPRTLAADSPAGVLDDVAFLAVALIELYEATGDLAWLDAADSLVASMDRIFWDDDTGSWLHSADDALLVRQVEVSDGPEPSGVARAAEAHMRLAAYGAPSANPAHVQTALSAASTWLAQAPGAVPTLAMVHHRDTTAAMTFVVAGADVSAARALSAPWSARWRPEGSLALLEPADVSRYTGLDGKTPGDDGPRAYLCFDGTCQRPVGDVDAVRALLAAPTPPATEAP